MRTLYHVPVIHTGPDMGSLATALERDAIAGLGQETWRRHQEVVAAFWDSVGRFFESISARGSKIYQDGLVADGAAGLATVRDGARRGSRNYEIIDRLLERGAVLVRTEDVSLVKQEHGYISRIAGAKAAREREVASLRYRLVQSRLLAERDSFVALRIRETLGEGETGALFIGAYHDVLSRLPDDIRTVRVKDVATVREYHETLAGDGKFSRRLHELARYLTSPVAMTGESPGIV